MQPQPLPSFLPVSACLELYVQVAVCTTACTLDLLVPVLADLGSLQAGCEIDKSFFTVENCEAQAGGGFRPPDGVSMLTVSTCMWHAHVDWCMATPQTPTFNFAAAFATAVCNTFAP